MMSRDSCSLPAVTGAEETPGLGGPALPLGTAAGTALRAQVMTLIGDVLSDSDPEREWARSQLRNRLAAHRDNPERAFLEHLIGTRRPDAQPAFPGSAAGDAAARPVGGHALNDHGLTTRIESVLDNGLLLTAFQPVHDFSAGRAVGVEALTRFATNDAAGSDTWFREAEAVGLGTDLEIAALRSAVSAAGTVPAHLFVALNLSPAAFADARVHDVLQNCGLAMDRIVIELQGRAGDEQWARLIRAIKPLRQHGLRVAVDGSGAGFTPAAQVVSLRPDFIKLDRTFISEALKGTDQDEPAAIGLAREVGAVLVAEGIETEAELAAVIGAGLTAGQGYLLGRPLVHPLDWSSEVEKASA